MKTFKIMFWKNARTNKWECLIREGDTFDWRLSPAFQTKEEAIAYASSWLQQLGLEFEVIEL